MCIKGGPHTVIRLLYKGLMRVERYKTNAICVYLVGQLNTYFPPTFKNVNLRNV